jgi:hypothetical protein
MYVATIQGIYFILTGLWPVFNIKSFEKISGPKTDKWLVKTFGLLVAVVGIALIASQSDSRLLGIGSAAALGIPEAYFSLKGRIPKTYLVDSAIELMFIAWWMWPLNS